MLSLLGLFGEPSAFDPTHPAMIMNGVFQGLSAIAATWIGCLTVRQPLGAPFLADAAWRRSLGLGFLAGALSICATTLPPAVFGAIELNAAGDGFRSVVRHGALTFLLFAPAAIAEELLVRGFVLHQLRRGIGALPAALTTSLFFALLHAGNPGVSLLAALNIALVAAGLALAVLRSQSIWPAASFHLAWNWTEGFWLGQPVSGLNLPITVLRRSAAGGAPLWTGGEFGPEASVQCTALLLIGAAILATRLRPGRAKQPAPTTARLG
jgi:uncharacterized protein